MIRFLLNLIFFPFKILGFLYYQISTPFRKGDHVFIEVPSRFAESRKTAFLELISGKEPTYLYAIFLKDLLEILENPYIKKVSFNVGNIAFGYGELEEILRLVERMNQKGIQTSGFAFTGDLKTLLFLSYMKERYTALHSEFHPILPSSEIFFFKGLLKKLGVEVESFASGKQKSFGEVFTREKFSPEARKNLEELFRSLKAILLTRLKQNFSYDWEKILTPILSGDTLLEIGFFHGILHEEEFQENLAYADYKRPQKEEEKKEDYKPISLSSVNFFARKKRFRFFSKKLPAVVILSLQGEILEGKKEEKELKEGSIHAYPVIHTLRELRKDSDVKVIILEIDSPGGSAFASALIYQEIKKLSAEKKVYAYMRNISASGGYFLACGCEKIYTHPLCITGSIGTVILKPELSGLYKKLGITKERVEFYPKRDLLSEYGKLSQESREFILKEIERVKNIFYDVVRENRKFSSEEMEFRGGGKVFTGQKGLELGLADSVDGLVPLLEKIQEELGMGELRWEYIVPVFSFKSLFKNWSSWAGWSKSPLSEILNRISKVETLYYSGFGFYLRLKL